MTRHEIRFKILELCYRKDWQPEDSVKLAKVLEAYVLEDESENVKTPVTPKTSSAGKTVRKD